jgi:MoxR-like ATPase
MATVPELGPHAVAELGARLRDNIGRAVKAPERVLRDLLVALLSEGHVLIEDYPGVGKTALARSLDAEYARVQCTADLLPADVVGTNVYNLETVADVGEVLAAQQAAAAVHGSDALRRYIVAILDATRPTRAWSSAPPRAPA